MFVQLRDDLRVPNGSQSARRISIETASRELEFETVPGKRMAVYAESHQDIITLRWNNTSGSGEIPLSDVQKIWIWQGAGDTEVTISYWRRTERGLERDPCYI